VTVLRDGREAISTLEDLMVEDQVLTFNHIHNKYSYEQLTDMSRMDNEAFNSVMFEIDYSSEDINGVLKLTPGHYVYLRRDNGEIKHMPSEDVMIGDDFLYVDSTTQSDSHWVKVVGARAVIVPTNDVIYVATATSSIVANGIYASCTCWW
jgi:hypothetical protein